jgi:hypothetical protein
VLGHLALALEQVVRKQVPAVIAAQCDAAASLCSSSAFFDPEEKRVMV